VSLAQTPAFGYHLYYSPYGARLKRLERGSEAAESSEPSGPQGENDTPQQQAFSTSKGAAMKTWEQINEKIESGKAVVLTAEEIIDYVDRKGLTKAAEEVDVVTTATFGPMCSSGCFLNFGHSIPRIRITEAWIDDVPVYSGVAAVDVYLGATELRQDDPRTSTIPANSASAERTSWKNSWRERNSSFSPSRTGPTTTP
jgi:hypothetical protein